MTDEMAPQQSASIVRDWPFRIGALLALAAGAGVILWLSLKDTGSSTSSARNVSATAVSIAQLRNLAKSVNHPVFWLGPRRGYTLELTRSSNGSIFVRYLPKGAEVGAPTPYLTVATYPFPEAYAAIQNVSKQRGITPLRLARHGLAEVSTSDPKSVHVAYPGVDYQIEIFDPTPGAATTLVAAGELSALGSLSPTAATATTKATSVAGLKSFARSFGHPVYWVGPRPGSTYELRHAPSGQVYIRYLPAGQKVGTAKPYLTVATYPFPKAFAAIRALAKKETKITLPGGGLAVLDPSYPKSIHLAYPGVNAQIEVFDPSASVVRRLVASGKVTPIGG